MLPALLMTWRLRAASTPWQERREGRGRRERERQGRSSHISLMLKHPRTALREGETEFQHNNIILY